jgi:hypothetical protein
MNVAVVVKNHTFVLFPHSSEHGYSGRNLFILVVFLSFMLVHVIDFVLFPHSS